MCDTCQKVFSGLQTLNNHIKIHLHERVNHNNESREQIANNKIECSICNKVFDNGNYLEYHIADVHERKKPFQCEICNYKFARKLTLEKHLSSKHKNILH